MKRALLVTGGLLLTAVTLAACSGGGSGTGGASTPASSPVAGGGGAQQFGGRGGPAASGTIAAISGDTLQVQDSANQTAVTLGAQTRYTLREVTALTAVHVGSCVVAMSAAATGGSTSITATAVQLANPVGGSCAGGAFGGGGFGGAARPGGQPSGFPSRAADGSVPPSGQAGLRRGGFAAGKVTAVSGSTITVQVEHRTASSAAPTSTVDTVHVTSATTYTTTVTATRAAVKVGLCAAAFGRTDSTGAVSATRLELSSPVGGSCTTGFRGRLGGGGGGANAGGPNG